MHGDACRKSGCAWEDLCKAREESGKGVVGVDLNRWNMENALNLYFEICKIADFQIF